MMATFWRFGMLSWRSFFAMLVVRRRAMWKHYIVGVIASGMLGVLLPTISFLPIFYTATQTPRRIK